MVLTIAGLTYRELSRHTMTFLLAVSTVGGCALLPLITTHTLHEGDRIIADNALALHFFAGMLLAGMAACHTMNGDIRRGTAAMVLTKPVARAQFLLGKFLGLAMTLAVFSALITPATVLAARVLAVPFFWDWSVEVPFLLAIFVALLVAALANYFLRTSFHAVAFHSLLVTVLLAFWRAGWLPREGIAPERFGAFFLAPMFGANLLIFMALAVLGAMALALSIRLPLIPTVVVLSTLFLAGLASDHLVGRFRHKQVWARLLYYLLPNWQQFWAGDAVTMDVAIPAAYLARVAAYAAVYTLGVLALAMAAFDVAELKAG